MTKTSRKLRPYQQQGAYLISPDGKALLNLTSNDYLGLASDERLQQNFLENNKHRLSSSSSRLLTGSFPIAHQLEEQLAQLYQREACLLYNSGYHTNTGTIPVLADKNTLLIADKLVHASIIDGIRLALAKGAHYKRYIHQNLEQLQEILDKEHKKYKKIIILTESLFSMDGDKTDIKTLCQLKKQYPNTALYIDEAHAFGVYGAKGLGLSEESASIQNIDYIIGAFGKAIGSVGGFIICNNNDKNALINQSRALIYSTALPPLNTAWSAHIIAQLPQLSQKRQNLAQKSAKFHQKLNITKPQQQSHIIPYILKDPEKTQNLSTKLQDLGYYCPPINPPTVPQNQSRLRLSLCAHLPEDALEQLIHHLLPCTN